jgi:arylsulfatase A-like enzyme
MKTYYLLHGALIGACLAGWASVVEAFFLYTATPYHTDPVAWSGVLPFYAAVGAVLGLGCAVVLPLFFRNQSLRPQRRTILGLLTLTAGASAAMLLVVRISWLASATGTFSGTALLHYIQALAVCWLGFFTLSFLHRNLLRRPLEILFSNGVITSASVGLLVLFTASFVLPVGDAKQAVANRADVAAANSPNVLLVVLDTVSAAHLGSYGYSRDTSPHLDALAQEGALFEQNYSAAPWTLPSHASIFTGLHPNTHHTGWEKPRLSDGVATVGTLAYNDYQTLAEELSMLGYDTCGVSEKAWLSAESGLSQGFESYWDYSTLQLQDSFFLYRAFQRYRKKLGIPLPKPIDKGGAKVVDRALAWLDGDRARDESRPFFLFMNLNEAHDPYEPPQEFWSKFLPENTPIEDTQPPALRSDVLLHREVLQGISEISPQQMALYEALYDAEIFYQDTLLGRLFDGLQALGLKEDTLIIVTADHGEEFGEIDHRVGHQLSLSDRLLHVPLIMRFPALIPAGRRVPSLSSSIDIFPTILEILEKQRGFPEEKSLDAYAIEGVSQLAAMQEGGAAVRDFVMAHYSNPTTYLSSFQGWDSAHPYDFVLSNYLRSIDIIRTLNDKLYLYGDGNRAFVDFAQDPTEQSSSQDSVDNAHANRAQFLEWRFGQQLNSYVVAKEMLTGNLNRFRKITGKNMQHPKSINTAGMTMQEIEEMGYVGGSVGDARLAEESISLIPFESAQRSTQKR